MVPNIIYTAVGLFVSTFQYLYETIWILVKIIEEKVYLSRVLPSTKMTEKQKSASTGNGSCTFLIRNQCNTFFLSVLLTFQIN